MRLEHAPHQKTVRSLHREHAKSNDQWGKVWGIRKMRMNLDANLRQLLAGEICDVVMVMWSSVILEQKRPTFVYHYQPHL